MDFALSIVLAPILQWWPVRWRGDRTAARGMPRQTATGRAARRRVARETLRRARQIDSIDRDLDATDRAA